MVSEEVSQLNIVLRQFRLADVSRVRIARVLTPVSAVVSVADPAELSAADVMPLTSKWLVDAKHK
jgi:hypothetical protein